MDKREQQIFFKNINETSFYFFIIIGLTHVISGLLTAHELFTKPAWLVNRLLDIPFFAVTYIYLLSLAKIYQMNKGNYSRLLDVTFGILGAIIVIALLAFDVIFDNQLPQ